MNNDINEYTAKLFAAADDGGWAVIEYQAKSPGWITLSDWHGAEITIRSPHGLDTEFYIRQLTVCPRPEPFRP